MKALFAVIAAFAPIALAHHPWAHSVDRHVHDYNPSRQAGHRHHGIDDAEWHHHLPLGCQHQAPGGDGQHVPTMGNATFTQLIDHAQPWLGTFEQYYAYETSHWKGPGSPIILYSSGESNASDYYSYLTTNRTTGILAEKLGAAIILIEHRYWGTSTPFTELTTENMQYLTLENNIYDMTRFAQKVKLPFARNSRSNAADVPWVWVGGSYPGALGSWINSVAPGTFWATWSTSAPVQAIDNYWAYFLPVQEAMPKNCSTDVSLVIDYMDNVLMTGTKQEILELKSKFGMENVTHNEDFMWALASGPESWQSKQFYTGYTYFDYWCDSIEGTTDITASPNATTPGPEGVGLEKALANFATWWLNYLPYTCQGWGYEAYNIFNSTWCFNSYDATAPRYTDTSLSNLYNRQWYWMLCNTPLGYWQDGAPHGRPTIVSRLLTVDYWHNQCTLMFPKGPHGETTGIDRGATANDVNRYTHGGWDAQLPTRVAYVNGQSDPWRESGLSAELRPSGPRPSTAAHPIDVIPGGFHCSDMVTKNGVLNAGVQAVIDKEIAQMSKWVAEFPSHRHWKS